MTELQKRIIVRLRNVGTVYRKIAITLNILRDKVKNYRKSVNLDGYVSSAGSHRRTACRRMSLRYNQIEQEKEMDSGTEVNIDERGMSDM